MHHDQTHSEAEKKIKEADHFWKRTKELDLSGMHLTELPDSLRRLTHLEILDLSNNRLRDVPDWIGDLTQLRELRLGSPDKDSLSSYPNLYSGPTINGILPIWINPWSTGSDGEGTYDGNPLISSMKGLNGKDILSTIDDYYISYESSLLDPYRGYADLIVPANNEANNAPGEKEKSKPNKTQSDKKPASSRHEQTNDSKSIDLPGSVWEFGCSPVAAGDIVSMYDQDHYPNLYPATNNEITDLPASLLQLKHLEKLDLDGNPLNPELAKAYKHGLNAVKAYLYTKSH